MSRTGDLAVEDLNTRDWIETFWKNGLGSCTGMGIPEIEHIKPNFTKLIFGGITIWFSYTTPVAFQVLGGSERNRRCVRVNDWGPTTGKHLNEIDNGDKKSRISGLAFEARIKAVTEGATEMLAKGYTTRA
tara:strand:+ start:212 stop:604 length:393 start_codon:yes stop_codon:yes gene_type:complete